MMEKLTPVIMAGGSGSRLWPLSRKEFPKQFLPLVNQSSMLQNTIERIDGLSYSDPIIICNNDHRFLVAEQLRSIAVNTNGIILEPCARNTAPAIAISALKALELEDDPILLVLAADHTIDCKDAFIKSIEKAIPYAKANKLVTFGVVPTSPETGYGYIECGEALNDSAFEIKSFKEKPVAELAQLYIEDGNFLWNSGIFLFKASVYLRELEIHSQNIYKACKDSYLSSFSDLDFIRLKKTIFEECPSDSIDYAVMEKTKDGVVIPLDVNWSDVGSWSSLWDLSEKDDQHNVLRGDVIAYSTSSSYIHADSALVATIGVEDLVIVQTKDAVLIANRSKCQDVKSIVESLERQGRREHIIHREVYRPWGKYDSIDAGDRYQVKRITVKPGEGLSVQMHHHRAEHWIVVAGTAKVSIDGTIKLLSENESVYIPLGTIHSLENPGKIPLDLIEVRSGSYLEEDDVVRFEDRYGRV